MQSIINNSPGRSYVYMNITTGASLPAKVVIELFDEYAPKTCENFRELCKGYHRKDPNSGNKESQPIGYKDTEFHRVVKGMYIQGGDLSKVYSAKGGLSIHGGEFEDESFNVKHTEPGLLGMCKRGSIPDTNEC